MKELVKFIDGWSDHGYSKGDIGYLLDFTHESDDPSAIVRLIKTKRGSDGEVGLYVIAALGDIKYIGDKEEDNEKIL